jgi:hypothetical protein
MDDFEQRDSIEKRGSAAYDGSMEPRVSKLEEDVARISADVAVLKTDVAVIKSNYVTKGDLNAALYAMSWRIFGAMGVLCAAVFWTARNIEPPRKDVAVAPAVAHGSPATPSVQAK